MKNSDMLNNLYKILRMNIILAKSNGEFVSEDTLQSFDDTAKKVDMASNEEYEKEIEKFYYATKSLDEEVERLDKLISLIDNRINERNSLTNDYYETVGHELSPLEYIKDEDKVGEYQKRYDDIKTYLSNKENISRIEIELDDLHKRLDESYENKKIDEKNNVVLESDLLSSFKSCLKNTEYFDVVDAVDIDFELEKIRPSVEEQLRTLNTFENAYNNLIRSGIGRKEEEEYGNYVTQAKKVYYGLKEKEFLYRIYKVILDSKSIYSELFNKRDELDNILDERLKLREKLLLYNDDILSPLYSVIDKQNKVIVKEKNVIDDIYEIEDSIKFKETRLEELKEDNRRVEILSLLQEFGIIDTYSVDIANDNQIEETKEEEDVYKEDNVTEDDNDVTIPNMVIEVKDAYPELNLGFARSKADTVMRRVGKSLGYSPEHKTESIVSFDFNKDNENKEEVKKEGKVKPITNSLSSLNLDNLNLNLKLDNRTNNTGDVDSDNIGIVNNTVNSNDINSIFPVTENNNVAESNNVENANSNDLDANVDKDFWSADEDKTIFPSASKDEEIKEESDDSEIKLASPLNILGGQDENGN